VALSTVQHVIDEARVLLLDTVAPYRYGDAELIRALNIAVLEARRLRPDLFLQTFNALPSYTGAGNTFGIEPMYRPSFVYYVVGRAQLRDDEATQDARAGVLMNKFVAQLLTVAS
jgi:hypothetical protein